MIRNNILDFFERTNSFGLNGLNLKFYNFDTTIINFSFIDNKLNSIIFHIEPDKNILNSIIEDFGVPILGMDSFLTQNPSENFYFGKISDKDFLYDSRRLYDYIILIWRSKNFIMQHFKNNSEFNNEDKIRFEILSLSNIPLSKL